MSWASYYHHALFGDVLLLIYEPEARPFSNQKKGNVVAIYDEKNTLIGVNIFDFSSFMKMKAKGRIPVFPHPVLEVINNILKNADLPTLEEPKTSGFIIDTVKEIKENTMIVSYQNQEFEMKRIPILVGEQLLIALPETILFNGKKVHEYYPIKENEMEALTSNEYIVFHREKEEDFFLR